MTSEEARLAYAEVMAALNALNRAWVSGEPPSKEDGLDGFVQASFALTELAVAAGARP